MMKNMTLRNMAAACGGQLMGELQGIDQEITSLITDSRKAEPGCLFAAIPGARVDGHSFIPMVLEKGALGVISEKRPEDGAKGIWLVVPSTLEALKKLARYYLEQVRIPVVGITGSVGKTSTKEMIAAVLSRKYRTLKTLGNFNNELGLPLTVFRIREGDEIAVLEMGINHFGEMHRLAEIARPDTCVITNIGQCHLEFLGDRDGVLRAKTEIFDFLRSDAAIFLNGDDDKLETIREVRGIHPVFFGTDSDSQIYADQIEKKGLKGIACRIHAGEESFEVTIPIPGLHMVYNALAGTAVGLHYGLTFEEIRQGIESLQPVSGRFHILETERCTIIDDCYNANPMSMKASLEILQDALGRKVAVLGDMGELGEDTKAMHRDVGSYAAGLDLDVCICIGSLCQEMAQAIREQNPQRTVIWFASLQEFLYQVPYLIKKKDTVLVKASHFMHFEKIVEKISCLS